VSVNSTANPNALVTPLSKHGCARSPTAAKLQVRRLRAVLALLGTILVSAKRSRTVRHKVTRYKILP